jgi:hypothetical protein
VIGYVALMLASAAIGAGHRAWVAHRAGPAPIPVAPEVQRAQAVAAVADAFQRGEQQIGPHLWQVRIGEPGTCQCGFTGYHADGMRHLAEVKAGVAVDALVDGGWLAYMHPDAGNRLRPGRDPACLVCVTHGHTTPGEKHVY